MAEKNFKIQNGLLVLEDSQFNDSITVNGTVSASTFVGDGSGLTGVGVDYEAISTASAAAVASANSYTDSELSTIDLTSTIVTASTAAVASANSYTDSELSTIDLTNTIITASAAAVNFLIDSAPETLNTLNELSAALNDDPNFYTTIQSVYLSQSNASTTYLTQSSASSVYATKAEVAIIDVDNLPDTFLMMGG